MSGQAVLLASLLAGASALAAPPDNPPVAVTGGLIRGRTSEDGQALVFQGIPFAAPPLGDRRWRPPAPVVPWQGVRQADKPAPACLQNDYGWNRATYRFGSEDCLTLDVRTPASAMGAAGARRPVMVWVHGGSNRAGGAGGTVDSTITRQGVVLVAIQYRLGLFGFLSHRALAAEQGGSSGNYGLMDQIAALRWVRQNIARFGGDPGNVTLFGESAGGQDVALLLASPEARGLVHKAVMQSGTPGFGMAFRRLDEAFALGDQLAALTNKAGMERGGTGGGAIDALRRTAAHALLAADLKLHDPAIWHQDFLWLRITIDGRVLPEDPARLLAQAPARPVILGSNRFEFGPSPGSIDIAAYARRWLGRRADAALAYYRAEEASGPDIRLGPLEARMETDFVFRCPATNLAHLLARKGWPVWRYEFDAPAPGAPLENLTSHGAEIGYILERRPLGPPGAAVHLQDYWVNLARSGNPNGSGLPRWGRFAGGAYAAMDGAGVAMLRQLRAQPCDLVPAL